MDINNVNKNNYIYEIKKTQESLELIQQKGNFNTAEILLMLLLGLEIDRAMYELKGQEEENG